MIPKIIHYCWFGGNECDEMSKKCIASWKKYCPDYEIIEWNESNFNINCCDYVKEAYNAGKWAFVSDYARYYIIYNYGGIYFDTDVEIIKPIESIIDSGPFMACEEDGGNIDGKPIQIASGLGIAAPKNMPIYKEIIDFYNTIHFIMPDGSINKTTVVKYTTDILFKYGLEDIYGIQTVNGINIYPKEYFCPQNYITTELNITENTVCIHHYNASWLDEHSKRINEKKMSYIDKYGIDVGNIKFQKWLKHRRILFSFREEGLKKTCFLALQKIKEIIKFVIYKVVKSIFDRLPLRNILFFECESDMEDNPRALYEYMINIGLNKKYKMVWAVNDVSFCKKNYAQYNVKFISANPRFFLSVITHYFYSVSKYFFLSHPYKITEWKSGQTIIHVNHGTPFKARTKNSNVDKRMYDYLLSASKDTEKWTGSFWGACENQILSFGYPRNDLLNNVDKYGVINKLFSFKTDDKLIISMSTYRKSSTSSDCKTEDKYSINVVANNEQLQELNDYLKNNKCHLILKIHPLQDLNFMNLDSISNIHYLTNRDLFEKKILLYELLGCADALITDCSSVFFDYLLLNRPIGFYMKDFYNYTRGYIMDNPLDYMPGQKINTLEDFYKFVDDIISGIDLFTVERERVSRIANDFNDNNNSKRLVEFLNL